MKPRIVPALLAGSLAAISGAAEAHFFQPVGDKTVGFFVGFIVEPAYEGEANGIEILAAADVQYDAKGNVKRYRKINEANNDPNNPKTHPEDRVRLQASVQILDAADPRAKVLFESEVGPLRLAQPTFGRYVAEFRPYPAGIYAIKLHGTVNGQKYNGRSICSVGAHETFTCVEEARPAAPDVLVTK